MKLSDAIRKFNEYRPHPLSASDVSTIEEICRELGLDDFTVVASGAYLRDVNNIIHVNPGFLASKKPTRNVPRDDTYANVGFEYRVWLSGQASSVRRSAGSSHVKKHCPLCIGLEDSSHELEECPRHP